MKPSAVIYSSRYSLAWSVSYACAGVALLGIGALLGKYLGEQAAAERSLDVAEWSEPGASIATVFRKSSLLRGSFDDRLITASVSRAPGEQERKALKRKDQERIATGRVVISAKGKDVRHKSEALASIVPMSSEVEKLVGDPAGLRPVASAKLPDRLVTDEQAGVTFDLPDGPMSKGALSAPEPLPGEIVDLQSGSQGYQAGYQNVAVVVPASYEEFSQPKTTRSPSLAKLSVMAARGSSERIRLGARRKFEVAEQICLAKAIYFEARSEPTLGQMAVAGVVLNRVRSKRYPNSICGVVFQNEERRDACQFSFACDGKPEIAKNKKYWRRSMQLAKSFATGKKKAVGIRNSMYYHADYVNPKWASKMQKVKKIGRHIFYQRSTRVASN